MADENISACTESGAQAIKDLMLDNNANRLVIGACTPKTHAPVFKAVLEDIGVPASYLEFLNLREHCAQTKLHEKIGALKMAKDQLRGAVARAALLEVVPIKTVEVEKSALVIGGGVAGIQASLDLGNNGFTVHLVERAASIGGKMASLDRTFPTDDCSI
ncbi:MAG: NAD(P)-binding protein [Promethearchaeota archaeon]